MALTRIIHWLGNSFVICALLMAVTAFSSFLMLDVPSAIGLSAITLAVGVTGVIFIGTTYKTHAQETTADALLFLLCFWIIMPALMAAPYLSLGAVPDFTSAYFEAVSAFTTTGASGLNADEMPKALLLWRSLIQWFGGICVATFAVVILAALNLSGTGVHRSMLFTLDKEELFTRLVSIGQVVAGIYAVLAALCFLGLMVTGTDVFSALCLALSGVSTGGLMPQSGGISHYVGQVGAFCLAIFTILGAMNISILWDFFRLRKWRVFRTFFSNPESRGLFVLSAGLFLLGLFMVGPAQSYTLFIESLFFVSTAGFDYDVIGLEMLPSVVLITVVLIGGSALSTAGGIKIIRLLLLFRHLFTDLRRLTHPSRLIPVSFKGQQIPDRAFLSIWMYFFGYTLFFGLAILTLGATGLGFEDAVVTGAASISNMGPLLDATLPESGITYADFTQPQKIISSVFMLIGRVEVLAVLILFIPSFWQR